MAETWDLGRYDAMKRHWKRVAPPLNITMAAFAGFKPDDSVGEVVDENDFEQFMREMSAS